MAFLLPPVEFVVGVGLLVDGSARIAGAAAAGLLLAFSAAITVNLAQGRRPDCHCFGKLHSATAGGSALARNLLLTAAAVAVTIASPAPQLSGWLRDLPSEGKALLAGAVVVALVLAAQTWLLLGLLRQQGRLLLRLDDAEAAIRRLAPDALPMAPTADRSWTGSSNGPAPGSAAPTFELADVWGEATSLPVLLAPGRPLFLVFTDPGCGPCRELLPEIAEWQMNSSASVNVVVISAGEADAIRGVAAELDLARVLVDPTRGTAAAYQVSGTPSAVLLDAGGRVTAPLAVGADAIRALVATTHGPRRAQLPTVPMGWPVGAEAPDARLSDLDGHPVGLRRSLDGRAVVLFFWNPGCGFCQQILEPLRQWERDEGHASGSPGWSSSPVATRPRTGPSVSARRSCSTRPSPPAGSSGPAALPRPSSSEQTAESALRCRSAARPSSPCSTASERTHAPGPDMDDNAFGRLARRAARARPDARHLRAAAESLQPARPADEGLDRFARALGRDISRRQALAWVGQATLTTVAVSAGLPPARARAAFCSTGYTDCGSVDTHPDCCRSDQVCCSMGRGGFCYDPLYDYCADPCGPIGIGTECCGEIHPGSTGFTYCQVGEKCCRDSDGFAFCCPSDQECRADHSCASCPAERDCGSTCCPPDQICTSPVAGTCAPCPAPGKKCGATCCAGGQDCCNGVCIDVLSDDVNCGSCGHVCTDSATAPGSCCNGQCCDPGLVCRDGVCLSCTSDGSAPMAARAATVTASLPVGCAACRPRAGQAAASQARQLLPSDGSRGICANPEQDLLPRRQEHVLPRTDLRAAGRSRRLLRPGRGLWSRCCFPPDVCLGGSCCPEAQVCGSLCCPVGEECKNGKCKKAKKKALGPLLSVLRAA